MSHVDREMKQRITEIHTREGQRRDLSNGEIAEVIAYDIQAYESEEIIPTRHLEAIMDFMAWKRQHAIEARIQADAEGEYERYTMGSGR